MPEQKELEDFSLEELLTELRARDSKKSAAGPPGATTGSASPNAPSADDALGQAATGAITMAVQGKQKVIYGVDDRKDVFELTSQQDRQDVESVAALFKDQDVTDNGDGTSTLQTVNFGTAMNLCQGERFREQPIGAFCSGFLVAPDIIATAGHCADNSDVTSIRFVFGYRMLGPGNAQTVISNEDIYRGVDIVGRQLTSAGTDWALVRIDREVTNRRVLKIRREGRIANKQRLHVIGHPVGLPTKFAGGANVRDNQPSAFFVANLDTYGGNSGSPVFNSDDHTVEGILVRGETDFVPSGNCKVSLVCPSTGCRGEDSTRTTEFQHLVPEE